ncbi:MAG: hypothetical protein V7756_17900 [Halopseudomonas sp.]|uniref:hypothetical protein n=1 Tax=Halopseudomonas sp. TaxID=2901191 RepID=UPI00300225DF
MIPILVSGISVGIAAVSLAFSILSWRHTNRPIIYARVSTAAGGNAGIALNILIENVGNRPAINIRIIASEANVKAALSGDSPDIEFPIDAKRCFFDGIRIPVLANGKSTSNAFGHLGQQEGSWQPGAEIPIIIKYGDLGRRKFTSKMNLLLADDAGFAQTFWGDGHKHG